MTSSIPPPRARWPALAKRLGKGLDEEDEHAVAGGGGEVLVEADVGRVERLELGAGGAHGVDRHLHVRDVAAGGALGREGCNVDLERSSHLEEVEQCAGVTAERDLEEVADEAAVRHGDPRAAALAD